MIFCIEISSPFRWRGKIERIGVLRRYIWGWFAMAYISADFNDLLRALRDSKEKPQP